MKKVWHELYPVNLEPSFEKIEAYIDNDLWIEVNDFLADTYSVTPQLAFSRCSAQPGWNIKYKKNGKSLCTLYPMDGYFIALVVIGTKEMTETEILLPLLSEYTRDLFNSVPFSAGGRWLMINITSERVLNDVKELIKIRVRPKEKRIKGKYKCK